MIRLVRGYSLKDVAGRSGLSAGLHPEDRAGRDQGALAPPACGGSRGRSTTPIRSCSCLRATSTTTHTGSGPEATGLGVLGDAIGGAGLDDAEAGFLAATLTAYRELRAAGAEPPTDFLLTVMLEYQRLDARGSLIGADEL